MLPLVCQAYKRAQLFPVAMESLNSGGLNPLHVAIQMSRFENTVLLFNECELHCAQALQPDKEGGLLHHTNNVLIPVRTQVGHCSIQHVLWLAT